MTCQTYSSVADLDGVADHCSGRLAGGIGNADFHRKGRNLAGLPVFGLRGAEEVDQSAVVDKLEHGLQSRVGAIPRCAQHRSQERSTAKAAHMAAMAVIERHRSKRLLSLGAKVREQEFADRTVAYDSEGAVWRVTLQDLSCRQYRG